MLAEDEATGAALGMAIWHRTFSSFACRTGCWLEDIFVRPEARGRGIGRMLLRDLAHRLAAEGSEVILWPVLDWNAPARDFYRDLGAEPEESGWARMRLRGEALERLRG